MKKIVFTFGRMNPPTIGHAKLVKKVQDVAKSEKSDARVYLSHTSVQDDPKNKKDPLNYKQKIKYAKKAFGSIVKQSNSKTVFQIMSEIEKDGYTDVIMVVGSDRVPEFKKLLNKYNGKDYNFDSISVVSAGERDPDATGVEGMSASKLRAVAKEGDFDTFKQGLPKGLTDADAKSIFNTINKVIKEEMEEERKPLTIAQRQKKARQMKRLAPKLARMRKLRAKRMADPEKLKKRAQKVARNIIRKKVAGERGADYSALSASEKITVDKLVAKKSAVIQKLAKRLIPKVRKAEQERLKQARGQKSETVDWTEEDFNTLIEETFMMIESEERKKEVAQDSDVKDMPGTQPKKYYKGLSDKEKEARAKQFAKGADKPDSDPASYKPAPGDAEAETKPSKHTKKYKKMFGEANYVVGPNTKRVRDSIKREKEADKNRHDNAMDRARNLDARLKNTTTEEYELSEDATAALKKKSEKSGIPLGILRQVYNRGMAAWKTGHRPGATQQQWGFARVNSFVTKSKGTWGGADSDLAAKVRGTKKEEVELDEMLKKEGSKWVLYSKDGSKKLGEFDTKEDALKRERQIQYFKHMKEDVGTVKHHQFQKTFKHAMKHAQIHQDIDVDGDVDALEKLVPDEVTGAEKNAKIVQKNIKKKEASEKEMAKKHIAFEAVSPAQQAAIAISKKERGEKPKKKKLNAMLGVPNARPVVPMGEEALEEMPRWLLEPLSKVTHKRGYKKAKELLQLVLDRKKKEGGKKGLSHSIEYYAGQIAKQFDGVDARVLADMVNESVDLNEGFQTAKSAGTGHTMFATEFMKIQGAYAHHPDVEEELERRAIEEEGGAGEEGTYELVKKYKKDTPMEESCCDDCESHFDHIIEEVTILEADGKKKNVKLNDPFRTPSGPKKFSVYVKNEKGNVVKVNFGDPNMEIKRDDPKRRKSFRARHNCDNPGPKWKARYWSCYQWRSGSKVDN